MSTGVTIIVIVAAVILLGALAAGLLRGGRGRGRGRGLRRRFGPEYDLALARHDGDAKAAEKELTERLRRHGDVKIQPLTGESRERYAASWNGVQEEFVEAPGKAVADAEQLLARLVRDRGYPADPYDEQVAALSVHHAYSVRGYRQVHAAADRARQGRAATEELREAVVGARGLFDELMEERPQGRSHASDRHRTGVPWAGARGRHESTKGGTP
ncbi:hypothetical protein AB0I22_21905 [Streptomyces sp. NPDC050610]|uniref:hypothetical protein n=1 Tax=Streptomyces sp. NPDC050610 TaxID=3157097 RepID=UPI003437CA0E